MFQLGKAWAFFRRDFRNDISYRLSFLLEVSNIVLTLASFYFLSKLLGERLSGGYAPFPFLLIGMAVNGYMTTSLYCFSQGIRGSQQVGALKAIFAAKVSPMGFVAYSAAYPIFRAFLDAAVFIIGGVLFGLSLTNVNVFSALVVFILSVAAFGSIGILSATFAVVFKKGDPLLWFFGGLSWLLGGVFYPLEVLPSSW
jgi:ABC-2 type transport system permease protein